MTLTTRKTYTTEVICLKAIDFGEADKILHLYSPEWGRISAIAKGVKKSKSKLAGACELLNLSEVQLSKGKSLDVLCQYQPRMTFIGIRTSLLKLAYAMLFVELVNLVAGEYDTDSHRIYDLLKTALEALDACADTEPAIVAAAVAFQMGLLETAGVQPVLDRCVFHDEPLDWQAPYYCFSPQVGGVTTVETRRAQPYGPQGPRWVNVSTATLQALVDSMGTDWECLNRVKVQKFLTWYFTQVFEKNLHATELLFGLLAPGEADEGETGS